MLPFANAFSPGDVLIGIGVAAFVVVVCVDNGGERALDPRRLIAPLRVAPYRLLLCGRLVSYFGDWLTIAALVGWIYERTGSTASVAILMLVRLGPPILGGGVAGIVVDRLPKARLVAGVELGRAVVIGGALASVVLREPAGVYVALGVGGTLAAVENAAAAALVPSLLPEAQLAPANAGIEIAKDAAMAVGAVGGGIALTLVGVVPALAVDALTFLVAAAVLGRIRVAAPVRARRARGSRSRFGLRPVFGRRVLLVTLAFAAATIATGLANATLPRFLGGAHGFGGGGYGYGIAALAAGLAVGEAVVGIARVGPDSGRWIGIGLLLMGALFALLGLTHHPASALLFLGAIGFVDGTTDVLFNTLVQRETDPDHRGAAFGFAGALMTTTMMAAFAAAPLLNSIGSAGAVLLGGSAFLVVGGVIALAALRRPATALATAPI
jgi:Major Facilitator Superfamily